MRKRSGRNEGTTGGRLLAIRRSASGTTWRSTHGRCVLHLPPKGRDRRNGRVDRPQCLVLSHRCRRLARRPCCGDGRPPIAAPRRARCSGSASLPASPGVRRALEPRGPQLRRRRLRAHAGPRPSAREDRARVGDAQVRARPIGIPHTDAGESRSGSALRPGTPSVAGEGAARPKAHRADHSIHPPEPLPRRALQRPPGMGVEHAPRLGRRRRSTLRRPGAMGIGDGQAPAVVHRLAARIRVVGRLGASRPPVGGSRALPSTWRERRCDRCAAVVGPPRTAQPSRPAARIHPRRTTPLPALGRAVDPLLGRRTRSASRMPCDERAAHDPATAPGRRFG